MVKCTSFISLISEITIARVPLSNTAPLARTYLPDCFATVLPLDYSRRTSEYSVICQLPNMNTSFTIKL